MGRVQIVAGRRQVRLKDAGRVRTAQDIVDATVRGKAVFVTRVVCNSGAHALRLGNSSVLRREKDAVAQ